MYDGHSMTANLRIGTAELPFNLTSLENAAGVVTSDSPEDWNVVVTPNLHHVKLVRGNPELAGVYIGSSMILPDGWPIAWMLARKSGVAVDRITGSDLLERVLESEGHGRPLVLVGGQDIAALEAVETRAQRSNWKVFLEPAPASEVSGPQSRKHLMERIASNGTGGLVILGLGAPKQEIFSSELRTYPGRGFVLCLGMAINFSAGRASRAPRWMQDYKMEWLHRLVTEPKRLGPRYLRDAGAFVITYIDNMGSRA